MSPAVTIVATPTGSAACAKTRSLWSANSQTNAMTRTPPANRKIHTSVGTKLPAWSSRPWRPSWRCCISSNHAL
jgi:hypothetical protein